MGLVPSLPRPGGNLTGFALTGSCISALASLPLDRPEPHRPSLASW
jgi:hypothetical protein